MQRALEGAGEVAVAGEAQPAPLGVADPQPLDDRRRRRTLRLSLSAHSDRERAEAPSRPVGPTWISVPIDGQTPQS